MATVNSEINRCLVEGFVLGGYGHTSRGVMLAGFHKIDSIWINTGRIMEQHIKVEERHRQRRRGFWR